MEDRRVEALACGAENQSSSLFLDREESSSTTGGAKGGAGAADTVALELLGAVKRSLVKVPITGAGIGVGGKNTEDEDAGAPAPSGLTAPAPGTDFSSATSRGLPSKSPVSRRSPAVVSIVGGAASGFSAIIAALAESRAILPLYGIKEKGRFAFKYVSKLVSNYMKIF